VVVKFRLENALEEAEAEITEILNEYGVPLVECSRCIVRGTIPSHGSYEKPRERAYKERFLQSARAISPSEEAADHQVVTQERLEAWLKEGVDPNVELGNAVLAGDEERVR